jgi:hypothetical protein
MENIYCRTDVCCMAAVRHRSDWFANIFTTIVTPSNLLGVSDIIKSAINIAFEHGGGDPSHPVTNTIDIQRSLTCPESYFVIFLG